MRRHPWLDTTASQIEDIIHGRSVAGFVHRAAPGALPASGVAALPSWVWVSPTANVGRKDQDDGGKHRLLLPARIQWRNGEDVITMAPGDRVEMSWRVRGLGIDQSGSTIVCGVAASGRQELPDQSLPPAKMEISAGRDPGELQHRSHLSRWALLTSLESWVERALRRANAAVAIEIHGPDHPWAGVLDRVAIESLRDRMMLGDGDEGPVARLIERCLHPDTFIRVDPARYIALTLRRDAEAAVRREIGDPPIGRKVRAIYRDLSPSSMDDLLGHIQDVYPDDRIGAGRAHRALSLAGIHMPRSAAS